MRIKTSGTWAIAGVFSVAVPLVFFLFFFVYPVFSLLSFSFLGDEGHGWSIFERARTLKVIRQSFFIAIAGTAFSLLFAMPSAYILYCLRFPGRNFIRALSSVPFVLPSVVVGIAFRALLDEGGVLGFLGLGQSTTAVVMAIVFFNFSVGIRTIGPLWARVNIRQKEAAYAVGAGPLRTFILITMPLLMPAILSAASLIFIFSFSAFGVVQTLGRPAYGTVETEIWIQVMTFSDFSAAGALACFQLIVSALAVVLSSYFSRKTTVNLSLRIDQVQKVTKRNIFLVISVVIAIFLLIFLPIFALVMRSFDYKGHVSIYYYEALFDSARNVSSIIPSNALVNSLSTALYASIIALVVAVPISLVMVRVSAVMRIFDSLLMLPLGVSSVVLGFGFYMTFALDMWGESGVLIPIVQAVTALPLCVRSLVTGMRNVHKRLREAAFAVGAGPWRVLMKVDGPYLMRSAITAFSFAFAVSLGEFGATNFLSNAYSPTLPVLISRLLSRPGVDNYGMAMASACILVLVTSCAMLVGE
ncbi:MAG: iron ABC transporter permease, partial [Actinomycetaceae bacterium]|nr:iron ABC transporter permease [Actinomycetaceae bacterium]